MALTSFKFIIFFLVVLTIYYVMPKKFQWMWLLAASAAFYYLSTPSGAPYIFLYIFASGAITYFAGYLTGRVNDAEEKFIIKNKLDKNRKKLFKKKNDTKRRLICGVGILLNLGLLCYVKYFNFFGEAIMKLLGQTFTAADILIPLGISFYTFQSTGYMIDICRGLSVPEKNPLKHLLFVAYFPTVLQGPISQYSDLSPLLKGRHTFCFDTVKSGLLRMVWGFFKKMVIADRVSVIVDTIFGNSAYDGKYMGGYIAIAAVMYAIQLYADFSGCMDICIGASEALDIKLAENFDCPYFARSIAEFWRRWHISLGAWFRNYLFYPVIRTKLCQKIAKSKKMPKYISTNLPTVIGLICVWLIMGFWHGSSWKFVFYGVYHGAFIIFSTLAAPLYEKLIALLRINTESFGWRVFQTVRTFAIVCLGYIVFRGYDLDSSFAMMKSVFTDINAWVIHGSSVLELGLDGANLNILVISVAVLFCVSLCNYKEIKVREKLAAQGAVFQGVCYIGGIIAILLFGMYGYGYDAASFIYFNF